jgi:hypothetical protein
MSVRTIAMAVSAIWLYSMATLARATSRRRARLS